MGSPLGLKIRQKGPDLLTSENSRIVHFFCMINYICKVYDVGEFHGQAYIAMQFIDGQPLSVVQSEMTRPDKVLTMALIAEAVHAAHRQGIIHRGQSIDLVSVAESWLWTGRGNSGGRRGTPRSSCFWLRTPLKRCSI